MEENELEKWAAEHCCRYCDGSRGHSCSLYECRPAMEQAVEERLKIDIRRRRRMSDKKIENNKVSVIGEILSGFTFSHEVFGEGFYVVDVAVSRLSGQADVIPLKISERLINISEECVGCTIEVLGQFRSYNRLEGKKNRLELSIFAREIAFIEASNDSVKNNQIYLDGHICKEPVCRKTPLGREIADLMLAVNRPYGKSDYIPCIIWGRNARYAGSFKIGTGVRMWGRIQSREYAKKISELECEKRIAYEVSVNRIELAP